MISLSMVGAFSIAFYFIIPGHDVFLTEGIIFLIIAAWVFARNFLMGCTQCCTTDIPHWKGVLASFIKPDGTIEQEKDGESVVENLMQVITATGDWIRMIKRDVFSLLFWPIVAAIVLTFSIYFANIATLQFVAGAFAVYIGALVIGVYFGVGYAFRKWQARITRFKDAAKTAMELL